MAENYELISAKDLPTTDAKEVDVVCVEGGELKRKPGASIGGGGGYVIKVPLDSNIDMDNGSATLEESYDNFIDILYNGGSVWVDFTEIYAAMMGGTAVDDLVMRIQVSMWMFMEKTLMLVIGMDGGDMQITFPNGTWTPPTAE